MFEVTSVLFSVCGPLYLWFDVHVKQGPSQHGPGPEQSQSVGPTTEH